MIDKALGPLKNRFGKPVVLFELLTTTPDRSARTITNKYQLHFVPKAVVVPKSFQLFDTKVRQSDAAFFTRVQGELYVAKRDIQFSPDNLDSVQVDGQRFEVKKLTVDTQNYYIFALAGFTDKTTHTGIFHINMVERFNVAQEVS